MTAIFQRRHYEVLAKLIGETQADNLNSFIPMVVPISNLLAADNPNFDQNRFRDAINAAFDAKSLWRTRTFQPRS